MAERKKISLEGLASTSNVLPGNDTCHFCSQLIGQNQSHSPGSTTREPRNIILLCIWKEGENRNIGPQHYWQRNIVSSTMAIQVSLFTIELFVNDDYIYFLVHIFDFTQITFFVCWISYLCIINSLSIFPVQVEFPLKFKHPRDCWFFFSPQWRHPSWNHHPSALTWTGCSLGLPHSSHFEMPFVFSLRNPFYPSLELDSFISWIPCLHLLPMESSRFVAGHIPTSEEGEHETLCVWKYLHSILIPDWQFGWI